MITKRDEDFNFRLIGSYDVSSIIDIVDTFSSEWNLNRSRQSMIDETHKYTNTYFVRGININWEPHKPLKNFQKE